MGKPNIIPPPSANVPQPPSANVAQPPAANVAQPPPAVAAGKLDTISPPRAGSRLAAAVGLCILLVSGAGYHWLARCYAHASQSVPIPAGTLGRLPLAMGDWTGRDVPLDERIIRATDTDDHVNRTYTRPGASQNVKLWVAYGVRFRDLMPHRPEVCYPGNGWTLDDVRNLELKTTNGSPLRCRILKFSRGTLRSERVTVLNYYLLDGQYSPDVAALRDRTWRLKSDLKYVAQVQIVSGDAPFQGNAETAVSDFAAASADSIRDLLAEAVSKARVCAAGSPGTGCHGPARRRLACPLLVLSAVEGAGSVSPDAGCHGPVDAAIRPRTRAVPAATEKATAPLAVAVGKLYPLPRPSGQEVQS